MKTTMKKNRLDGRTIEIGGLLYKVKYVGKIHSSNTWPIGRINFDKRTIEIEKGLSSSEEISVIIHELCHGALETILPVKILEDYEEVEELIVGPFARIFAGALRSAGLLKE